MTPRVLAIPEPLRDALAVHEAFRKLRFTPDEIFIHPTPRGLQVVLRAQEREFVVDVGPRNMGRAAYITLCRDPQFVEKWSAAVELWNEGTDEERKSIWRDAPIIERSVEFVTGLVAKGFHLTRGGWN